MSDTDDIIAVSMSGFDTRIDTPSPQPIKIESEKMEIEMKEMSNTENPIAKLKGAKLVPHSKRLQEYLEGDEIKGEIVYQKCKTCQYNTCVLDTWDDQDKICRNCEVFEKHIEKSNPKPLDMKIIKELLIGDNLVARKGKDGDIVLIEQ